MGVPEDGLGTSELADMFGERIDNKRFARVVVKRVEAERQGSQA